jgi:hypothetical protein
VHHQQLEGDQWQKPGAATRVITAQAIMLSRPVVLLPTSEWDEPDELFRPWEPAAQSDSEHRLTRDREALGLVQQLHHGVHLLLLAFGNVLGKGDRIRILT